MQDMGVHILESSKNSSPLYTNVQIVHGVSAWISGRPMSVDAISEFPDLIQSP